MKVVDNTELVKAGVRLIYSDACNYQKWEVTEVYEDGFEAIDDEGFEDYFEFNSLQNGWEFK